jgi:YidC/Oxa1 family membrane protein insertase
MEKNTILAVVLSTAFLIIWFSFFQPKPKNLPPQAQPVAETVTAPASTAQTSLAAGTKKPVGLAEKEIALETKNYKAVFTTIGASVKHWYMKEANEKPLDLVFYGIAPDNAEVLPFETLPELDYKVIEQTDSKITFLGRSTEGYEIRKTYIVSDTYRNNLTIEIIKLKAAAVIPPVSLTWGFGLGSDELDAKNNLKSTEIIGFDTQKKNRIKKLKPEEIYYTKDLRWAALKNRHFVVAFVFPSKEISDQINLIKQNKKSHPELSLALSKPKDTEDKLTYSLDFFLGPKEYALLQSSGDNLVETIHLGFLGTIALKTLLFFHKILGNYGWAIILLTIVVQIIVLPLTIKSYKATGAMKELQPQMKALQDKFKSDPKRLNAEMMNLYKSKKVNPLSGCLPMLLQLPIFYALFATLQNAYELRGADWIFWVNDLSRPDTLFAMSGFSFHVLPFIMGIGMFLQQKLMSVSADPSQASLVYIMPIMFTVLFWGFPSGLVLYWLTNSVLSMLTQYLVMPKKSKTELIVP